MKQGTWSVAPKIQEVDLFNWWVFLGGGGGGVCLLSCLFCLFLLGWLGLLEGGGVTK